MSVLVETSAKRREVRRPGRVPDQLPFAGYVVFKSASGLETHVTAFARTRERSESAEQLELIAETWSAGQFEPYRSRRRDLLSEDGGINDNQAQRKAISLSLKQARLSKIMQAALQIAKGAFVTEREELRGLILPALGESGTLNHELDRARAPSRAAWCSARLGPRRGLEGGGLRGGARQGLPALSAPSTSE